MNIEQKISQLSNIEKRVFAVLCCEKTLPNYKFFVSQTQLGDINLLEAALEYFYTIILNQVDDKKALKQFYKKICHIAPDLDEIEDRFAAYGLDACSAFAETCSFFLTHDDEHFQNIAIALTDSVDMFIQEKEDYDDSTENLEDLISGRFYMTQELNRQNSIIQSLSDTTVDANFLRNIRKISNDGNLCDLKLLL